MLRGPSLPYSPLAISKELAESERGGGGPPLPSAAPQQLQGSLRPYNGGSDRGNLISGL